MSVNPIQGFFENTRFAPGAATFENLRTVNIQKKPVLDEDVEVFYFANEEGGQVQKSAKVPAFQLNKDKFNFDGQTFDQKDVKLKIADELISIGSLKNQSDFAGRYASNQSTANNEELSSQQRDRAKTFLDNDIIKKLYEDLIREDSFNNKYGAKSSDLLIEDSVLEPDGEQKISDYLPTDDLRNTKVITKNFTTPDSKVIPIKIETDLTIGSKSELGEIIQRERDLGREANLGVQSRYVSEFEGENFNQQAVKDENGNLKYDNVLGTFQIDPDNDFESSLAKELFGTGEPQLASRILEINNTLGDNVYKKLDSADSFGNAIRVINELPGIISSNLAKISGNEEGTGEKNIFGTTNTAVNLVGGILNLVPKILFQAPLVIDTLIEAEEIYKGYLTEFPKMLINGKSKEEIDKQYSRLILENDKKYEERLYNLLYRNDTDKVVSETINMERGKGKEANDIIFTVNGAGITQQQLIEFGVISGEIAIIEGITWAVAAATAVPTGGGSVATAGTATSARAVGYGARFAAAGAKIAKSPAVSTGLKVFGSGARLGSAQYLISNGRNINEIGLKEKTENFFTQTAVYGTSALLQQGAGALTDKIFNKGLLASIVKKNPNVVNSAWYNSFAKKGARVFDEDVSKVWFVEKLFNAKIPGTSIKVPGLAGKNINGFYNTGVGSFVSRGLFTTARVAREFVFDVLTEATAGAIIEGSKEQFKGGDGLRKSRTAFKEGFSTENVLANLAFSLTGLSGFAENPNQIKSEFVNRVFEQSKVSNTFSVKDAEGLSKFVKENLPSQFMASYGDQATNLDSLLKMRANDIYAVSESEKDVFVERLSNAIGLDIANLDNSYNIKVSAVAPIKLTDDLRQIIDKFSFRSLREDGVSDIDSYRLFNFEVIGKDDIVQNSTPLAISTNIKTSSDSNESDYDVKVGVEEIFKDFNKVNKNAQTGYVLLSDFIDSEVFKNFPDIFTFKNKESYEIDYDFIKYNESFYISDKRESSGKFFDRFGGEINNRDIDVKKINEKAEIISVDDFFKESWGKIVLDIINDTPFDNDVQKKLIKELFKNKPRTVISMFVNQTKDLKDILSQYEFPVNKLTENKPVSKTAINRFLNETGDAVYLDLKVGPNTNLKNITEQDVLESLNKVFYLENGELIKAVNIYARTAEMNSLGFELDGIQPQIKQRLIERQAKENLVVKQKETKAKRQTIIPDEPVVESAKDVEQVIDDIISDVDETPVEVDIINDAVNEAEKVVEEVANDTEITQEKRKEIFDKFNKIVNDLNPEEIAKTDTVDNIPKNQDDTSNETVSRSKTKDKGNIQKRRSSQDTPDKQDIQGDDKGPESKISEIVPEETEITEDTAFYEDIVKKYETSDEYNPDNGFGEFTKPNKKEGGIVKKSTKAEAVVDDILSDLLGETTKFKTIDSGSNPIKQPFTNREKLELETYLGDLTGNYSINFVQRAESMGRTALGYYQNGVISLVDGVRDPYGVLDHEIIHNVFNIFTPNQREAFFKEATKVYGKDSIIAEYGGFDHLLTYRDMVEEKIADEGSRWARDNKPQDNPFVSFFNKLWNFLKDLLGVSNKIEQLFSKIYAGKFKDMIQTSTYTNSLDRKFAVIDREGFRSKLDSVFDIFLKSELSKQQSILGNLIDRGAINFDDFKDTIHDYIQKKYGISMPKDLGKIVEIAKEINNYEAKKTLSTTATTPKTSTAELPTATDNQPVQTETSPADTKTPLAEEEIPKTKIVISPIVDKNKIQAYNTNNGLTSISEIKETRQPLGNLISSYSTLQKDTGLKDFIDLKKPIYGSTFNKNNAIIQNLVLNLVDLKQEVGNKEMFELLSYYQGSAEVVDSNRDSQYFTPPEVSNLMVKALKKYGYAPGTGQSILEPSAGSGSIIKFLSSGDDISFAETNPFSSEILKVLYPNAKQIIKDKTDSNGDSVYNKALKELFNNKKGADKLIEGKYFDTTRFENIIYDSPTYDFVIGNPPFGEKMSDYAMSYFGYSSSITLDESFAMIGIEKLKEGGVLAFVNPNPENKSESFIKYVLKKGVVKERVMLPIYTFTQSGMRGANIQTEIFIFEKKTNDNLTDQDIENGVIEYKNFYRNNPQKIIGKLQEVRTQFGTKELYEIDGKGKEKNNNYILALDNILEATGLTDIENAAPKYDNNSEYDLTGITQYSDKTLASESDFRFTSKKMDIEKLNKIVKQLESGVDEVQTNSKDVLDFVQYQPLKKRVGFIAPSKNYELSSISDNISKYSSIKDLDELKVNIASEFVPEKGKWIYKRNDVLDQYEKGYVALEEGEYSPMYQYLSGKIWNKLEILEKEYTSGVIDEKGYLRQKELLNSVAPTYLTFGSDNKVNRISLGINERVVIPKINKMFKIDLKNLFLGFLRKLDNRDGIKLLEKGMVDDFPEIVSNRRLGGAITDFYVNESSLGSFKRKDLEADPVQNEKHKLELAAALALGEKVLSHFINTQIDEPTKQALEKEVNNYYVNVPVDVSKYPVIIETNKQITNSKGKQEDYKIRDVQIEGLQRVGANGSQLIAVGTGGGKTAIGILSVEQSLNTGKSKRPLTLVPQKVYSQYLRAMREILPHRLILGIGGGNTDDIKALKKLGFIKDGKLDFSDFIEKAAKKGLVYESGKTPEGIIVVGTHSILDKLTFSDNVLEKSKDTLAKIFGADAVNKEGRSDLKQTKSKVADFIAKAKSSRGEFLDFDALGVDQIITDEAHNLSNVFTNINDMADFEGVEDKGSGIFGYAEGLNGSAKPNNQALNHYLMGQYINSKGGSIVLLTATPMQNRVQEPYTLFSLVGGGDMSLNGIPNLKTFLRVFVKFQPEITISAEAKFNDKPKLVIRDFTNKNILIPLLEKYMFYRTPDEIGVPRPFPITTYPVLPQSEYQKGVFATIRTSVGIKDEKDIEKVKDITKREFVRSKYEYFYRRQLENMRNSGTDPKNIQDYAKEKAISSLTLSALGDYARMLIMPAAIEFDADYRKLVQTKKEFESLEAPDDFEAGIEAKDKYVAKRIKEMASTPEGLQQFYDQSPYAQLAVKMVKEAKDKIDQGIDVPAILIYNEFKVFHDILLETISYYTETPRDEMASIMSGVSVDKKDAIKNRFNNMYYAPDGKLYNITKITDEEKKSIKKEFDGEKIPKPLRVLVGTSVMSEGLDLQNNSNMMLILSFPWNPTKYTQLVGRIIRSGSPFSFGQIIIPVLVDSPTIHTINILGRKQSRQNSLFSKDVEAPLLEEDNQFKSLEKLVLETGEVVKKELADESAIMFKQIIAEKTNISLLGEEKIKFENEFKTEEQYVKGAIDVLYSTRLKDEKINTLDIDKADLPELAESTSIISNIISKLSSTNRDLLKNSNDPAYKQKQVLIDYELNSADKNLPLILKSYILQADKREITSFKKLLESWKDINTQNPVDISVNNNNIYTDIKDTFGKFKSNLKDFLIDAKRLETPSNRRYIETANDMIFGQGSSGFGSVGNITYTQKGILSSVVITNMTTADDRTTLYLARKYETLRESGQTIEDYVKDVDIQIKEKEDLLGKKVENYESLKDTSSDYYKKQLVERSQALEDIKKKSRVENTVEGYAYNIINVSDNPKFKKPIDALGNLFIHLERASVKNNGGTLPILKQNINKAIESTLIEIKSDENLFAETLIDKVPAIIEEGITEERNNKNKDTLPNRMRSLIPHSVGLEKAIDNLLEISNKEQADKITNLLDFGKDLNKIYVDKLDDLETIKKANGADLRMNSYELFDKKKNKDMSFENKTYQRLFQEYVAQKFKTGAISLSEPINDLQLLNIVKEFDKYNSLEPTDINRHIINEANRMLAGCNPIT